MTEMRVAFFGSSLLSALWNGAATYYRGIIRAMAERGWQVTFYEPDAYGRQDNRDIDEPWWARVQVYPSESIEQVGNVVENAAGHADLVIKASGVGVHDAFLDRAVLQAKRPGQLVAFWDVDAPATLERLSANPEDPFAPLIPRYDLILTYGGGEPVVNGYGKFGARMCVPVYNALDPETHHPAAPDPRFGCGLSFLGNRLPDREARVYEYFFNPAKKLSDYQFLLGGSGWDGAPYTQNVRYAGHVFTADHNAWNASSLAVLNISRDSMARFGFSPATRIFEAAGAGACIITDAWQGIGNFLEPGAEVLVAANGEEVAAHLDGLMPGRARAIGRAALRRVLEEHTYSHRADQLERIFGGANANRNIRSFDHVVLG